MHEEWLNMKYVIRGIKILKNHINGSKPVENHLNNHLIVLVPLIPPPHLVCSLTKSNFPARLVERLELTFIARRIYPVLVIHLHDETALSRSPRKPL